MMHAQQKIPRSGQVLLVDDDDNDVFLTRECFALSKYPIALQHVSTGQDCLSFLRKQGKYWQAKSPDLVLLDLLMPGMNGQQVLHEMTQDNLLKNIPVVVLSHSKDKNHISHMFQLGCHDYIIKTINFMNLRLIINSICETYFGAISPPKSHIEPNHEPE